LSYAALYVSRWGSADLQEEDYEQQMEVRLDIPDELKLQLLGDWEKITKNYMVPPPLEQEIGSGHPPVGSQRGAPCLQIPHLPTKVTVESIVAQWAEQRSVKGKSRAALHEIGEGIKVLAWFPPASPLALANRSHL
jgi:hypothetical protein